MMEKKIFLLEPRENSTLIKVIQIVFGVFCIGVTIFWLIYYIKSQKTGASIWLTITFLAGFGFYQILAGFGKTIRYIETGPDRIKMKQNSFLPSIVLKPADIDMIELFPLSIAFHIKNRKKSVIRFGITYPEIIDPVKMASAEFAEINNIPLEERDEEL